MAKEDEVIGTVPILDDVQALLNRTPQPQAAEIPTEEDGPARVAQLDERPVGRMLDVMASKTPQNGFRLGGPQPQRRGLFHHGVVLRGDEVPADGTGQHRL